GDRRLGLSPVGRPTRQPSVGSVATWWVAGQRRVCPLRNRPSGQCTFAAPLRTVKAPVPSAVACTGPLIVQSRLTMRPEAVAATDGPLPGRMTTSGPVG